VSGAAVDLVSAEESSCSSTKCSSPLCAKCNPPFKLSQYLNATNAVVIMLFFGSTAMCTRYAVLANIEPAKIATFAVAVGSAMFGAASELFAVKGEVREVRGEVREVKGDIKEGQRATERLEQKVTELKNEVKEFKAEMKSDFKELKNEVKGDLRTYLFASFLLTSVILFKPAR
jgi:cell division protein FtsL